MADIFISYANADHDRVAHIADSLSAAGYSVWWDSKLRGGSRFSKEIETELTEASAVIVVWTNESIESRWVADEADLALRDGKLVPVKLDNIEAPIGFRQIQTIDYRNPEAAFPILKDAIDHHVEPARPGTGTAPDGEREVVIPTFEFSPPLKPSIAVLPFKSLGADPGQDFLADGLRFGIQATLVQLSGLFLVNASTLNNYRETDLTPANVGKELEVQYVLEGQVQQSGNRLRVIVQVIEVSSNRAVWADRYDRIVDDVFELQDEITHEIISSLNIEIQETEAGRVWFKKLKNRDAREYYYRGASHLYDGDLEQARVYFEKLYEVEPTSVTGPSNIAICYWLDYYMNIEAASPDLLDEAAKWAELAMTYDDNNGLGHAVMGYVELIRGNHEEAQSACEEGVRLRTSCPVAHGILGLVQVYSGDADAAVQSASEGLQLERFYPSWLVSILATAKRDKGEMETSIAVAKKGIELEPDKNNARLVLCSNYNLVGREDEAKTIAGDILKMSPDFNLSKFANLHPYKDVDRLNEILDSLKGAGLPS